MRLPSLAQMIYRMPLKLPLTAALALAAVAPIAAQSSCLHFQRRGIIALAHPGRNAVSADINGDGHMDAVVATTYGTVDVLLGHGDGSFAPPVTIQTSLVRDVALEDMNGDGHVDLVVAGFAHVDVFLGVGDGTFDPLGRFPSGIMNIYGDMVLTDLDGDGDIDAAVVNDDADTVSVLLGDGAGGLGPRSAYPVRDQPRFLAEGDFDGDGAIDLVVSNWFSTNLSILRNAGDGSFTETGTIPTTQLPEQLFVRDLDGDGNLDILVLLPSHEPVPVMGFAFGDGAGGFGAIERDPLGDVDFFLTAAELTDLDGDGLDDLVTTYSPLEEMRVFFGGTTDLFGDAAVIQVGAKAREVVSADWDGDGLLDLGVSLRGPDGFFVMLQRTPGFESVCATTPNSFGPGAVLTASGSPHVGDDDLTLTVTGVPPGELLLIFAGNLEMRSAFGSATLCIGGTHGLLRILPPSMADGTGAATRPIGLTDPPFDRPETRVIAGSTFYFQCWYRDTAALPGERTSLSNSVRARFCL